jgi:hypothetical protein
MECCTGALTRAARDLFSESERARRLALEEVMRTMPNPALAIVFAGATMVLSAQWLHYPTRAVPKSKTGKPDLTAPAPRGADGKPDLSGIWQPVSRNRGPEGLAGQLERKTQFWDIGLDLPGGLPYQPWAAEIHARRKDDFSKDNPDVHCLPLGILQMQTHPMIRRIMQTPGYVAILHERDMEYRQIFTDGRPLPKDPQPSWNGYSTGTWQGDTLVVQSIGFRDGLWADYNGSPLTGSAKITERFRRLNYGNMEVEVTVDDPKAYTKPWTVKLNQSIVLDTDLLEYVCLENEKDVGHIVGK